MCYGLLFFVFFWGGGHCFVLFCMVAGIGSQDPPPCFTLIRIGGRGWMDVGFVCVNSILTPAPVQLFAPSNGLEYKKLVDLSAKLLDYSQRGSDCDQKIATVGRFYMNYLYYATVRGLILAHKNGICLCSFRTKYNTVLKH